MLRRPCVECHAGAESKERAGWPAAAACHKCHTAETAVTPLMKSVAAWPAEARPYPQSRLYRTRDFVIFSHAAHHGAKVTCAACHGAVTAMEPLKRYREVTMQACIDCHKQHNATQVCNACHDLGQ